VEPLWIHIADELLEDLRTRLHQTRWPEQIPGIGWEQGTELDWLRRLVSYWAHEFDWRARAHKRNALHHFTWEGLHFVHVVVPSLPGYGFSPRPREVGVNYRYVAKRWHRLQQHSVDQTADGGLRAQ